MINQLDVKGAFLHAQRPPGDYIHMRLPIVNGIPHENGRIFDLQESLYGLRQAPKLLYSHLYQTLVRIGLNH